MFELTAIVLLFFVALLCQEARRRSDVCRAFVAAIDAMRAGADPVVSRRDIEDLVKRYGRDDEELKIMYAAHLAQRNRRLRVARTPFRD